MFISKKILLVLCLIGASLSLYAQNNGKFKTEKVIVVVIDGPRHSEAWGDASHQYIPNMAALFAKEGVVYPNFRNSGGTYTSAGHTAVATGVYQKINNSGMELPENPSIFQYYNKMVGNTDKTWIITSKGKLDVLANCNNKEWKDKHMPNTYCGIEGKGNKIGYNDDSKTFAKVIEVLESNDVHLMLVNFKEPDNAGHKADWDAYLSGLQASDKYVSDIWKYIESNDAYKGKTALIVTYDHGRHLDGHKDGFVSHGDDCEGCRHLNCFAIGPDFKKGQVQENTREQIDIAPSIAYLLNIPMPKGEGKVMSELLINE